MRARPLVLIAFGVLPVALTAYVFAAGGHAFAYDFHQAFWPAGRDVLHGSTPYVTPTAPEVERNVAFIYPAVAALLFAPFALLSRAPADQLFAALNILAVLGALRLLAVRDWRLYGLVLLAPSVFYGWHQGNVTLLIVLGVVAVWRWRDRAVIAGLLVALLVSVKLFVWPLGLWLLATRRYAAAAVALGAGVVLNLAAWLTLGFDQLPRYRELLGAVTRLEERSGYSVVALASHAGVGRPAAYALMLTVAGLAAVACVALGRSGRAVGALTAALALSLASSPILWLPYFALLIVPLALTRPRLSPAWLLLLPMWAGPCVHPAGWHVVLALACAAAIVGVSLERFALPRALGTTKPPPFRARASGTSGARL